MHSKKLIPRHKFI